MPNGQIINGKNANVFAGGAAYKQILGLDGVTANTIGIWGGYAPFRNGSLEVTCVGAMLGTVNLLVSNAQDCPPNGFAITVGGSFTPGDVVGILIASPAFFASAGQVPGVTAAYVVVGGDNASTIAAALRANMATAIATAAKHPALGEDAQAVGSALQVGGTGAVINLTWQADLPAGAMPIACEAILPAGVTETLTIAQYDSGAGTPIPGCALSAPGLVQFNQSAAWMKTTLTGYAGTGAISANVMLTLP